MLLAMSSTLDFWRIPTGRSSSNLSQTQLHFVLLTTLTVWHIELQTVPLASPVFSQVGHMHNHSWNTINCCDYFWAQCGLLHFPNSCGFLWLLKDLQGYPSLGWIVMTRTAHLPINMWSTLLRPMKPVTQTTQVKLMSRKLESNAVPATVNGD